MSSERESLQTSVQAVRACCPACGGTSVRVVKTVRLTPGKDLMVYRKCECGVRFKGLEVLSSAVERVQIRRGSSTDYTD